jgi:uncharacterized membrane protein
MTYNRTALKEGAKEAVRGIEPHPAYTTFVYLLLSNIIAWLIMSLSGYASYYTALLSDPEHAEAILMAWLSRPANISGWIVVIALGLASTLLALGWLRYCMKLSKREQGSTADLFSCVKLWGKGIVIGILIGIFTTLWYLLLIFPAFIAVYRYSQAFYILLEHPEYTPLQCIRESKRIMRGNKWKLFVLQLSFIGWGFLISLTFGILGIWKNAYINVSYVRFYEYVRDANAQEFPVNS